MYNWNDATKNSIYFSCTCAYRSLYISLFLGKVLCMTVVVFMLHMPVKFSVEVICAHLGDEAAALHIACT